MKYLWYTLNMFPQLYMNLQLVEVTPQLHLFPGVFGT